ncbi:MAG: hypothetical protein HZC44_08555 [Geobacter sp.]|nr:hypothetical protein [Geobacter sp.]
MKSHGIRRIAVLAMPHFRQAAGAACKEKVQYGFPDRILAQSHAKGPAGMPQGL